MSMKLDIAGLERMTVGQLQARYAEVFGEPARSGNRQWLFRRVAWRIQMLAEGDLSERARERARDLVRDADLRVRPKFAPGPRASNSTSSPTRRWGSRPTTQRCGTPWR
jgi:hypothetical protein